MKIYLGADHAGFLLKEKVKSFLKNAIDLGNKKLDPNDDFPMYGKKVAQAVAKKKNNLGVLICGSGQGVCIAANKIKGIRAAVAENKQDAFLARKDDDVNVLCLSGRTTSFPKARIIIQTFLKTKFESIPRRKRRLNEIKALER